MRRDCLMWDYQSLGSDWFEEIFDSKETWGTAAVLVFESHTKGS